MGKKHLYLNVEYSYYMLIHSLLCHSSFSKFEYLSACSSHLLLDIPDNPRIFDFIGYALLEKLGYIVLKVNGYELRSCGLITVDGVFCHRHVMIYSVPHPTSCLMVSYDITVSMYGTILPRYSLGVRETVE